MYVLLLLLLLRVGRSLAWPSGLGYKVFGAGLMGTVDPIPAGFSHRTLLVAGQVRI
jgi:hypothetical protein